MGGRLGQTLSPSPGPGLFAKPRALLLVACAFFFYVILAARKPDTQLVWRLKLQTHVFPAENEFPPPLPEAVAHAFAVVTPTADHRHALVKGMRAWRRGVRTLVLTNATGAALEREQAEGRLHGERWVHFPDVPGFQITNKSGDLRAAVGPALAAAQLGPFRWLLYSDDDVAFFWPGLLRMLAGLDPDDPYLLSDSYWSRWDAAAAAQARQRGQAFNGTRNSQPPKPEQPRCLPCTFNSSGIDLKGAHAFQTCSCSVAAMAAAFKGLLTGRNQWRDFPATPPINSIDGAGGAVVSAGLLRRLDTQLYTSCIAGREAASGGPTTCGGGDCLLTACLWHQGFGYTDPGFQLRHADLRSDMFLFNGARSDWQQVASWAAAAMTGGACTGNCSRLWLDSMVSVHTGGANMTDYAAEGARVGAFLSLMGLYAAAGPPLEELAERLVG